MAVPLASWPQHLPRTHSRGPGARTHLGRPLLQATVRTWPTEPLTLLPTPEGTWPPWVGVRGPGRILPPPLGPRTLLLPVARQGNLTPRPTAQAHEGVSEGPFGGFEVQFPEATV